MNNTYGIVKPSIIDIANDVEVWYHFRPTRASQDETFKSFKKISATSVLKASEIDREDQEDKTINDLSLPGMYDLSLPASIFNKIGYYTIYIKPKEIYCTIKDIGALSAYPDINGIVVDLNGVDNDVQTLFRNNDSLVGYRVEYFQNGDRQNYYRIITGNNCCEPMSQNLTNANVNSNGYRFNDSSETLVFLTVTPNTSPSYKSSTKPYIGTPNQKIVISNTKFDPVSVEVELCDVDFDTLNTTLNGDQVRDLDNSLVTTFNKDGEIFSQHEFFTIKDNYNTNAIMDVKLDRKGNINTNVNYQEILEAGQE